MGQQYHNKNLKRGKKKDVIYTWGAKKCLVMRRKIGNMDGKKKENIGEEKLR